MAGHLKRVAQATFHHALKAVAPAELVRSAVRVEGSKLFISNRLLKLDHIFDLTRISNLLIVGAGKASQELCHGLVSVLQGAQNLPLNIRAYINIPEGQPIHPFDYASGVSANFLNSAHPILNQATLDSTQKQLEEIRAAPKDTLVIALISGGGSALFEATDANGQGAKLTLADLQLVNRLLLESGASIGDINIVRKHLSQVKGGHLARHCLLNPNISSLVGIYLSDVVGNDLSSVASGPTSPDPTTFADSVRILKSFSVWEKLPASVKSHLEKGLVDASMETPKPGDKIFDRVINVLVGSADTSALAADNYLRDSHNFELITVFSNTLDGEARAFGLRLIETIDELAKTRKANSTPYKAAFIATGEFTVTLRGKGMGGRNQEMLLAFLMELSQKQNSPDFVLKDVNFVVVACAFDGIEGNSPATGALVDRTSLERISTHILATGATDVTQYLKDHLERNDSYNVFKHLDDAFITGYTGTNVNDMVLILLESK